MEGLQVPQIMVNETELSVFTERAKMVVEEAERRALTIKTALDCEENGQWVVAQKEFIKSVEGGWLGQIRDMWHKQHESVCAIIRGVVWPHKAAIEKVDARIKVVRAEIRARIAADQAREQEELKKRDEEQRINAAVVLEAQGNKTMADAVLAGAGNFTPPPVVQKLEMKSIGGTIKWIAEIQDLHAFMKYVAERPAVTMALKDKFKIEEPIKKWLEAEAKNMAGNVKFPGVRFYEDEILRHRKIA